MKTCSRCRQEKSLEEFYACKSRADGKQHYCKICQITWQQWYKAKNADIVRTCKRSYQKKLHIEALSAYSNGVLECAGCEEADLAVLTLHHVNEDGAEHRRQIGTGTAFLLYLKQREWPNNPPLAVLCWNCNHRVRVGTLSL